MNTPYADSPALLQAFSADFVSPTEVAPELANFYRDNGFVRVRGIIPRERALELGRTANDFAAQGDDIHKNAIFKQLVNVWRQSETLRGLTLDHRIGNIAEQLAGVPLRLWHDQLLIKTPRNGAATEWHQDQPYWPHAASTHPISMWIALCDVPVEKGCMTFLPGSHRRTDLPEQNLASATSLFEICPDLQWESRVTLPLQAGDCTFHHGRCAHMATPNLSDEARIAHVVIWMDATTTYTGAPHIVTQPLGLKAGGLLAGEMFPLVEAE